MNKGLIVQTRQGIGDLCMFLPYMQQIKEHNKDFEFTLITQKRTAAKQILKYEQSIKHIFFLEDEILGITKSKETKESICLTLVKS